MDMHPNTLRLLNHLPPKDFAEQQKLNTVFGAPHIPGCGCLGCHVKRAFLVLLDKVDEADPWAEHEKLAEAAIEPDTKPVKATRAKDKQADVEADILPGPETIKMIPAGVVRAAPLSPAQIRMAKARAAKAAKAAANAPEEKPFAHEYPSMSAIQKRHEQALALGLLEGQAKSGG